MVHNLSLSVTDQSYFTIIDVFSRFISIVLSVCRSEWPKALALY